MTAAWKVLIADDEPKIRRGLKSILERIDPSVMVVAEAEDGEEAYELACSTLPDILFIDIRMPFLNGLELIERLSVLHKDWIVIIVTGHDEFEYARKAVSLQVFDFLLKPVDEEALRRILEHGKTELSLRRESDKYVSWARKRLEENMAALREAFILQWLSGTLSKTEIEDAAAFLSLTLPENPAVVVVRLIERTMGVGTLKTAYRKLMTFTVKSIVEEILGPTAMVVIDGAENVVALSTLGDEELRKALVRLEAAVDESVHQVPLIAQVKNGILPVAEAYEDALGEVEKKCTYETFVLLAQSYIEKNYPYPELSLEETAAELQISPGYLSRLMKLATGLSFIEYLTRVRINGALRLMEDPSVKIFEVAERVGYRSQHYFSRAFRKVLGFPPSDYKKGGALR